MRLSRVLALAVSFGCLASAVPAHAGILLEPYLKYEFNGGVSFTTDAAHGSSTLTADQTGLGFGARVGYRVRLVSASLDYSMASGKLKASTGGGGSDTDFSETQLFAVIGLHLPIFQAYAGYGIQNNLTSKSTPETTYSGSAIKLGVGYTGFPIVSIGVEYVLSTYDKIKTTNGDISRSDAGLSDLSGKSLSLVVSAPFDF